MNENSFNYDSLANLDDASCYNVVNGCMDTLAFNFNDWDFDGYPNPLSGINGEDVNTAIDDCDYYGCMQPGAENYDSLANINASSIDSILIPLWHYAVLIFIFEGQSGDQDAQLSPRWKHWFRPGF